MGKSKTKRKNKLFIGNRDGLHEGLVIASSQREAAAIAGTTLYDFRQYWHVLLEEPPEKFKRGVLYIRPYADLSLEWEEKP